MTDLRRFDEAAALLQREQAWLDESLPAFPHMRQRALVYGARIQLAVLRGRPAEALPLLDEYARCCRTTEDHGYLWTWRLLALARAGASPSERHAALASVLRKAGAQGDEWEALLRRNRYFLWGLLESLQDGVFDDEPELNEVRVGAIAAVRGFAAGEGELGHHPAGVALRAASRWLRDAELFARSLACTPQDARRLSEGEATDRIGFRTVATWLLCARDGRAEQVWGSMVQRVERALAWMPDDPEAELSEVRRYLVAVRETEVDDRAGLEALLSLGGY